MTRRMPPHVAKKKSPVTLHQKRRGDRDAPTPSEDLLERNAQLPLKMSIFISEIYNLAGKKNINFVKINIFGRSVFSE